MIFYLSCHSSCCACSRVLSSDTLVASGKPQIPKQRENHKKKDFSSLTRAGINDESCSQHISQAPLCSNPACCGVAALGDGGTPYLGWETKASTGRGAP